MDDRYIGKVAWLSLFTGPKQEDRKQRTGKVVGSDPMGVWIEECDVRVDCPDGPRQAKKAHVLVRWDKIDELVVLYEGESGPGSDDVPVGFK